MVEHTFFDQHFDALFAGVIVIAVGLVGWVANLQRTMFKTNMNEHRITQLEEQLTAALEKAEKDHAEIRKSMTEISNKLARIEGKLDKD